MTTLLKNRHYIINDPGKAYRIVSGTVTLFVYTVADEGEVVRVPLADVTDGYIIPGCSYITEFDSGIPYSVEFDLLATSDVEYEVIDNNTDIVNTFCEEFLPDYDISLGFNNVINEWIENFFKEEARNIELAEEATQSAQGKILNSFEAIFADNRSLKASRTAPSGIMLYDAAARICNWMLIPIAPYTDIIGTGNKKIRLDDIARISGFVTRSVILEPGWQKKDLGPLLVFYGDNKNPYALLPKEGTKGYYCWRPDTREQLELDDEVASQTDLRAYMFYKSFPSKPIDLIELLRFSISFMKASDVFWIFMLILLETLIGILIPTMNEKIYDLFIPLADASGLLGMCYVIIACTIGNVAFGLVKGFTNFRCFNRIKYNVQAATFDRLFNMPSSFTREYDSAELAQKAFGAGEIIDLLSKSIFLTGFAALFSLFYLHKMRKYSKKMTKIAIIALLICMLIILLLGVAQEKLEEKKKKTYNKQSSILYQLIAAIDKLRIAGAEQRGLAQYFQEYEKTAVFERAIGRIGMWNTILNGAMSLVSSIIFYYLMIRKDMGLSMGSFLAFTSAFGAFSAAMLQLVSSALDLSAIKPDYDELKPILQTEPEIDTTAALPGEISGRIDVNKISFAYRDNHYILDDFSLSIKEGEYVGVVGSSGCGKSTLLKVLLGFETPQKGKVFYDDMDIESVNKRELRKQFGVVLQNGDTIAGSIYENITITDPSVSMEDVQQAVKDAGLEEDIAKMPMGLNTVLSEGGGGVSGGQKQRILIARAIVTKPKVLFFDEATSALDNKTQQQICESIEKLDCTKFIIAHRLTTIMNCDRIIVMDAGKIVEEGTYSELMAKEGLFYQLAKRQMA